MRTAHFYLNEGCSKAHYCIDPKIAKRWDAIWNEALNELTQTIDTVFIKNGITETEDEIDLLTDVLLCRYTPKKIQNLESGYAKE